MKEVIKISSEYKRNQMKSSNSNTNEAKLNNFLNKFEIILSSNKSIRKDEMIREIESNKSVMKDLALELGVNIRELMTKMQLKIVQEHKVN